MSGHVIVMPLNVIGYKISSEQKSITVSHSCLNKEYNLCSGLHYVSSEHMVILFSLLKE